MAQFLSIFWQDTEGFLDFLPGEKFKYINVTIIDNSVPELDKVFRVNLYNPNGGGKKTLILCPFFYFLDFSFTVSACTVSCGLHPCCFLHGNGTFCVISKCTMCDSCLFLSGSCVLLKWIHFLQAKRVEVARVTLTCFFRPFTIIMVRFFFSQIFLSQFTFSSFPLFAVIPDWILFKKKKKILVWRYIKLKWLLIVTKFPSGWIKEVLFIFIISQLLERLLLWHFWGTSYPIIGHLGLGRSFQQNFFNQC